jgi:hypothetical protein
MVVALIAMSDRSPAGYVKGSQRLVELYEWITSRWTAAPELSIN